MRKSAREDGSTRMRPSAPTDRWAVQTRRVRSTASATLPARLSMITKSFPPPAIFENRSACCSAIGIFVGSRGLNPPVLILARNPHARNEGGGWTVHISRRNALRSLARLTAALLCAATAAAQQPQPQSTELPKLTETIDIRVINVDVVVTDKKGNPVAGLTKDDFNLYENGVPKNISNFYEVEGKKAVNVAITPVPGQKIEAPPATVREEIPENMRRRIIFYIDNLSLAPFNRNRVFKEMKEFAKNVLRPGDEAMIATFNRSMKTRLTFTRDIGAIQTTLDTIAGESAMGLSNRSESRDVMQRIQDAQTYDDAVQQARSYAESVN